MKYLAGFIAGLVVVAVAFLWVSDPYVSYPLVNRCGDQTPAWKYK